MIDALHILNIIIFSGIMPSVFILSGIMLSVVMLIVFIIFSGIMLSVVMLSVINIICMIMLNIITLGFLMPNCSNAECFYYELHYTEWYPHVHSVIGKL